MSWLGKDHESVDVIMKNWFKRLSLMLKHSCCQSKKWLFELFHLCAVKLKFLPWTYKLVVHVAIYRSYAWMFLAKFPKLVVSIVFLVVWVVSFLCCDIKISIFNLSKTDSMLLWLDFNKVLKLLIGNENM